ncbi:MAG: DUF2339 domain-containing protein [Thermoanaerobaculales bacterium]|jgi:hypothetical protein|nr:DUF2339 domain-containing protein [Thermoanaerobaculales bacterium]
MEMVLIVAVISLPVLAFGGLLLGIAALVRLGRLGRRVDELEGRPAVAPDHPVAGRLRELERRLTVLEGGAPVDAAPPREVAAPVPPAPEVEPAAEPLPAAPPRRAAPSAAAPTPPVEAPPPPREPLPAPPERPEPPAATAGAAPSPPFEPPSTAPRRPSLAGIDWERWIGVRGAAAAGGIVLALASLLFFQYSIEHGLISPTMRVVLGTLAGIGCLIGSERLVRRDQEAAGNALAGAGVVILYGATWAAQNLYGLIGTAPAFVLMVLITAVCVTLAVARHASFVAVLGLLGGFATPLLVASDVDSPAALFGYILLLDLGLLWLARARGWPLLSLLCLVGTALHQALWIFQGMDPERAGLGLAILAVFGVAFLVSSGGEGRSSMLWRATRAGGVAIPFAFALHFAGSVGLSSNPWPLGGLLLVLSAGACWLERQQTRGAAVAAAAASLGVMALWFLDRRLEPALAWQAVALCVALAALFTVAAELALRHDGDRRLGLGALVSSLGLLTLVALAAGEGGVVRPWPWLLGWTVLGGLLVLHSRWPGRAWTTLPAGLAPALGLLLAVGRHGRSADGLEPWAWLGLAVAVAVVLQLVGMSAGDGARRTWAERAAAATALALMPAAAVVGAAHHTDVIAAMGSVLLLGLLAALAATRARSGWWLLAATAVTALWHTIAYADADRPLAVLETTGTAFWLLAASAALFTVWPSLVPRAFRESRAGWWGAALAGPLWFVVLRAAFESRYGDAAIGLLPVALGAIALAAGLRVRPRLEGSPEAHRTSQVWYLAVALSMVSVAIPLQLENEWVTIGWALNGLAILALWVRLDHPGLKAFGLALLGAATVRLVANPEVLSYHVPSATPVLNWLTYTYLVPAAALVLSLRLLRPLEVDRLRPWEAPLYPGNRPIGAAACGLAAVVVVFAWINLAIADAFATGSTLVLSLERLPARDATTSVAWAVYALILLAIGVRTRSGSLRWLSLGILVLTLGKVFLHDLGELEDLYRVGSLVGLAVSLIVVSLIYQRFVFRTTGEDA